MPDIYQLKVTLLETKPPIWRRLLVPTDLILGRLHDVLQIAMGWHNEHLYEFHVGKQPYGRPNPDDQWFGFGLPTINDRKVRLEEVLPEVRSKLVYTYDMGDSWEHSVVVEKRLPADPAEAYPVCIGGERACPPEDIGGIPGFYRFMKLLLSSDEIEREGATNGSRRTGIRRLSRLTMSIARYSPGGGRSDAGARPGGRARTRASAPPLPTLLFC